MNRYFLIFILLSCFIHAVDANQPALYGYGVRSCDELVLAAVEWEQGTEKGAIANLKLEQWMSGFISALSLATGKDLTSGSGVESLVQDVVRHCEENRNSDVFGATMAIIKERGEDQLVGEK